MISLAIAGNGIKDGYGRFKIDGSMKLAHRVSFELSVGPIPEGMCVLHKCDNPPCVRPSHLFIGSHADNTADKVNKGRCANQKGEANSSVKLTEEDIVWIRQLGSLQRKIAKCFDISQQQVSKIKSGKHWAHVGE